MIIEEKYVKCPNCGEWIFSEHYECPSCYALLHWNPRGHLELTGWEPPSRNKWFQLKGWLFLFAVIFIFVTVGVPGACSSKSSSSSGNVETTSQKNSASDGTYYSPDPDKLSKVGYGKVYGRTFVVFSDANLQKVTHFLTVDEQGRWALYVNTGNGITSDLQGTPADSGEIERFALNDNDASVIALTSSKDSKKYYKKCLYDATNKCYALAGMNKKGEMSLDYQYMAEVR